MRNRLLAGCALAAAAMAPAAAQAQLALDGPATVSAGGRGPTVTQTARVTDITLGAPRTVLNWSTFNLTSDSAVVYRFEDRSWIVLNRVGGQAVIDGQVEALAANGRGGNVWFYAPGGVIFGGNARVNVGGLLATSAAVAQSAFLDPGNFSFAFTGAGASRVEVRAGADIKAGGGPIALIASSVTTAPGASVTGGATSSVLYGAANDFTVRFAPQPGDLDLLDFVVPAGGGTASTTPLALQGATAAGSVFLAVVNRADIASAVISAPGLIAAQSASADRGDVVLSAGNGIANRQPGATRVNTTTETTANFGVVTATRDLLGGFSSPTSVNATQLAAGRDLGLAVAALDTGSLGAGRSLAVDSSRGLSVRGNASAGGTAVLRSTGAIGVAGAVNAVGRLQIDAGSLTAGQLNSGRSIVVNAGGAGANGGPAVSIASALAEDDIQVTTTGAAGSIVLGQATFTGAHADEAPAGRNLILTARGASADITYGAATGSPLTGATSVTLAGGRDVTVNVSGLLTLGPSSAGRTFTIRAMDLDLVAPVTAASFRVESLQGAMTLGGTLGASSGQSGPAAGEVGLRVTDAEFQMITVTQEASFYAGSTVNQIRGDLTVQNLNVNPARIPRLLLAAGNDSDVLVPGIVAPGVTGGVVTIGEADPDSPWRPARILVTGSVGASQGSQETGYSDVRAFNEVNLNARNDVLIGAQRFIALVANAPPNAIDVMRDLPTGVAPTADERNRVFITAAELTLRGSQRIVQQNTGSNQRPNGILLTSQQPGALTASPAGVVDLWGAFRDAAGNIRGGILVLESGFGGSARFNGCDASAGGCGPLAIAAATQRTLDNATLDQIKSPRGSDGDVDDAIAGLGGVPPDPPVLTFADPNAEADVIVTDPVMLGSGSDEVWRQKRKAGSK
ncbi:MAG: filamentous hemagglutinin N-terminal domain-containing protein [Phenylobacterium sp.]|uniref:two-partner secretion domain-containing protein n=1 Tax=Phenylobacterium sp. TaxID=1871053 RepID=UPI001A50A0C8|nr:filamentous hemagglutinin N-terminal domain-containing protein [Phenylobacterium sp.]MBL8555070.1 filamentous hemagglutinin N-terminal domain-containing protein [Phenylobacterium sp.]